ncbi:signal peptidase II [Pseudoclavibacter chungangensis]|uniref:signal peptidase II n=1 Tax=Pseudoclavibacter chungangensis TaxID=587635 RepID=UPI0018443704|nr:signal peptidase II [Pseudoclavibacter chungangensis]NYJ66779.1 signal peptidase II [Pseudoclavibacter chungangensis]
MLIGAVALCVYGLDQLTKAIVERSLTEGEPVPVLGRVLQWYFVRNPGAAFSFAEGQTWLFTGFAIVMIVVIVVVARRIHSARWAAVFGLVLGGVLGNLTDRLLRPPGFGVGHVVDFISTPWLIPAIYNIADMGIVFGMILFVLLTVLDVGFDGVRRRSRSDGAPAPEDEPDEASGGVGTPPAPGTDEREGRA